MSFQALVVPPQGALYRQDIHGLHDLQKLVGGYLEGVRSPHHAGVFAYLNEEGALQGLPPNLRASLYLNVPVVGTVLFVGSQGSAERDCPPEVEVTIASF